MSPHRGLGRRRRFGRRRRWFRRRRRFGAGARRRRQRTLLHQRRQRRRRRRRVHPQRSAHFRHLDCNEINQKGSNVFFLLKLKNKLGKNGQN